MKDESEKQYMMTAIMKEFNYQPPMSLEGICEGLIRQGYGNVKKSVKEFADNIIDLLDEMGMERSSEYNDGYDDGVADCITNIKSRLAELYGTSCATCPNNNNAEYNESNCPMRENCGRK